jgi:A/G-specific adenine glycosylase
MRIKIDKIHPDGRVHVPIVPKGFFARWYEEHGRVFPWRRKTSPFGVVVAEVLLRQTRASMVAPVWGALRRAYPTPHKLASARSEELGRWLAPLGLQRQRVQALKALAAYLEERHGGKVPKTRRGLLAVPHLGMYAASAVRVFAFGYADAVVDTNVVRVLTRLTGRALGPDPRRDSRIEYLAGELLERRKPREHNFGLLDFAAAVCKPQGPLCHSCPLIGCCAWGQGHLAPSRTGSQKPPKHEITSSGKTQKIGLVFR